LESPPAPRHGFWAGIFNTLRRLAWPSAYAARTGVSGAKSRRNAEKVKREGMRAAGRFNAELMDVLRPSVQLGITTGDIDRLVHDYTLDHGHIPAMLNYQGFPNSCCTSVNEAVCNGVPGVYVLKAGDIINVTIATVVNGWYAKQSETFLIGQVSADARALVQCAFDCLYLAIDAIIPNSRISDIGSAIVRLAHSRGYTVVRDYVGHGIGRKFHQDSAVCHVPTAEGSRLRLPPGLTFTIQPMINAGVPDVVQDDSDGWTVRTRDGRLSAQFEHTILMTAEGPEILTLTKAGPQRGHRF